MRSSEATRFDYKNYQFLITDMPADSTLDDYLVQLKKHRVDLVVRVCETTYNAAKLEMNGVEVKDLVYEDGGSPSADLTKRWFDLVKRHREDRPEGCVAVHCVAGLGRAPVMVALTLMELGMEYEEAVEVIREKRRGALNAKQLKYLEKYRPRDLLKTKKTRICCII